MGTPASRGATLLTNAAIYTGNPANPWAANLTVRDGLIETVDGIPDGSHVAHDLGGAFVMPGLVDAHNHHAIAGIGELYEFSLPVEAGIDELLQIVRSRVESHPDDEWIVGNGWSPLLIDALAAPSALDALDAVTEGRPTVLREQSRHNRWVNRAALRAAGIHSISGRASDRSGLLVEADGLPVEVKVAEALAAVPNRLARACEYAIGILHRYGVTAFQDAAASLEIMSALRDLDEGERLTAWVVSSAVVNDQMFGITPSGRELVKLSHATASAHHRPTFAKVFLDGIPPMRTAAFLGPNACGDEDSAMTMDPRELAEWLHYLADEGLSVKIHCTGDASVRAALDAVQVVRRSGRTRSRFHIAHGQYVHPSDVARFAELNVVAEISPFVWYPGVIPEALASVLPAEFAGRVHPNRDLLDAGALIAAGSDWPVSESPDPLAGIAGLVTRADPAGRHAGRLWPEQAVTLPEAIAIFTSNGAQALGLDDVTGTLAPGRSADFVTLDRNPFELPVHQLASLSVRQTWFAGSLVYER
jgi:predicted amidohydrolase YtcJ